MGFPLLRDAHPFLLQGEMHNGCRFAHKQLHNRRLFLYNREVIVPIAKSHIEEEFP